MKDHISPIIDDNKSQRTGWYVFTTFSTQLDKFDKILKGVPIFLVENEQLHPKQMTKMKYCDFTR